MTVYKYFLKIALKYRAAILSYTLIFFVLAIINGSTNAQKETNFVEAKLDIGIIDNSQSALSTGLVNYLREKNNIIDTFEDERLIKEQIFLEVADAVIVIPDDFEEKVVNKVKAVELYRDDRKIGSFQIENQLNKYIAFANATYNEGVFDLDNVHNALAESTSVKIVKSNGMDINQKANQWFKFYFNFISYVTLGTFITVLGLVMMDFNEQNIENRRKISSKRYLKFNKEIYLGQLTLSFLITSVFILGSVVLKGKYIREVYFTKYLINTVIFSFTALSLTFLINNVIKNRFILSGISTVLSLGTSFISGVMVPQQFLGEKVLNIAKFFPTYYFVRINEMNISSLSEVKYELSIQVLFAFAFLLLGLYFSKVRQKA